MAPNLVFQLPKLALYPSQIKLGAHLLTHHSDFPGLKCSPMLSMSNFTHPSRYPNATSSRQSSQMPPHNFINGSFLLSAYYVQYPCEQLLHINSRTPHTDSKMWIITIIPKLQKSLLFPQNKLSLYSNAKRGERELRLKEMGRINSILKNV